LSFIAQLCSYGQTTGDYNIQGVPFNRVSINDQFWLPKIETNRTVTIPSSFKKCEETGRVENFVLAAKKTGKFLTTFPFDDTDIYKIIEGASFSMSVHPDPALDKYVDSLINLVAKARNRMVTYILHGLSTLSIHIAGRGKNGGCRNQCLVMSYTVQVTYSRLLLLTIRQR